MLLTPKRIFKLLPIILLIMLAIYLSSLSFNTDFIPEPIANLLKISDQADLSFFSKKDEIEIDLDNEEIYIKNYEDKLLEVDVEYAESEEEKLTGLMYRESLCEDCGMLFIYEEDTQGGFWMKNCEISLDIIFIDRFGDVVDIKNDFEPCDQQDCPAYKPDEQYRYVLEMNGGWAEENKISPSSSHLFERSN